MDYRTDEVQIIRLARPFLDWGALHGKQVRVALEAGPLTPEVRRGYQRDKTGELWQLRVGGVDLLILLATPLPNPYGMAFRQSSQRPIDGRDTSFREIVDRLWTMLPRLERTLSAWPGFAGIALHELD